MNKTVYKNFVKILSVAIATGSLIFNASNAASRTAVRGSVASRRPVASTTRTGTTTNPVTTETPATTETTPEPVPETAPAPEPEPEIFENKTSQFDVVLSGVATNDGETLTSDLAEQIRKQRAAAEARDDLNIAISNLQKSSKSGKNTCDAGLRQCMQKNCGEDFTKCATDGDTLFGDKLNKCRRETTCTGEEFRLFTTEIKADRDMNVKLSSYNAVINCGNNYNSCIQKECGQTFEKCLGKTAADNAVKKCATTAKNCTEQDSGLAARFGKVIGGLRLDAEQDVTNDEKRLLELRNLMRKQCEHLGAMFDERSFDCVYTVNFFAGTNQTSPMASRKLYAGDTFICTQEWFGTNVTTFKENAYRETRAQTAASSAMLGSGLGTAAGLISSGAIDRALDTQRAKKSLKDECKSQGGTLKNGECVSGDGTKIDIDETTVSKGGNEGLDLQAQKDACATQGTWDDTANTCDCHDETKTWEPETKTCASNDEIQNRMNEKIAEIKKSLENASLYGREISFTKTEQNDSEVSAELSKWGKRCKEAKVEGRVIEADVKETTSGDKVVWKCVATKCDDSGGIKYELKDGDCVPTSDTGQNIIDAFGEKYILSKKKINDDTEETSTTESEFDTPQWSREQYQQCYANINVGHSVGRTYWAKSDNGQFCESCTGGKCLYNRNKNPNTCKQRPFSDMSNGEWEVKLKNGKSISGISMCSTTRGSNRKDGEYDLKNNIDTSGTGFNCWCKITHTELTECIKTQQFPWVFVEEFWQISDNDLQNDDNPTLPAKYFTRGANSCSWSCAQECGYKFFDYNSYIILQSHGVEYIQDYYTKK